MLVDTPQGQSVKDIVYLLKKLGAPGLTILVRKKSCAE